jgi:hypothetical protein
MTLTPTPSDEVTLSSDALLDEIQKGAVNDFWHEANPQRALVQERAKNLTSDKYHVASIAAVGFGLPA